MTDARLEKVYADRIRAGEFLDQAELSLSDAREVTLELVERARVLLGR